MFTHITIKNLCAISALLIASSTVSANRYIAPESGVAVLDTWGSTHSLSNDTLAITYNFSGNNLSVSDFQDKLKTDHNPVSFGELFKIKLNTASGIIDLVDTSMVLQGVVTTTSLIANPTAIKLAERYSGKQISATYVYTSGENTLTVDWRASLRDGSNYVIHQVDYTATTGDWDVQSIHLVDITSTKNIELPGVTLSFEAEPNYNQTLDGTPFFSGQLFFAQESPVSKNSINGKTAASYVERGDVTKAGASFSQSSSIGVYWDNQKRRGFNYYIERERVQKHAPNLHVNGWWDIDTNRLTETNVLNRINQFGQKLKTERNVTVQSIVLDDGWDNHSRSSSTLWGVDATKFPNDFPGLINAGKQYDMSTGIWISPAGGYGSSLYDRVYIGSNNITPAAETHNGSYFKLSGANYFELFNEIVAQKQQQGINHFKFDRTIGIEDFHSLLKLSGTMRKTDPEVYINATVGTWHSPYFLFYVDSIWRGGNDLRESGTGSRRQKWLNYRDNFGYEINNATPFMPLNSMMMHGIIHSHHGLGAYPTLDENGNALDMTSVDVVKDFKDEVRSFFAYGLNIQELYIDPDKMTDTLWDAVAEGAKWAELNKDVLLDSHFFGGDPSADEVYGIASWSTDKAVLMMRNPSAVSKTITVDIYDALELPLGANVNYNLDDPYTVANEGIAIGASTPHTFTIAASSMLIFEAIPTGSETLTEHPKVATGVYFVSDMDWLSASTGWAGNPTKKDLNISGGTLTINSKTYSKGLGAHAPNEVIYALNGNYDEFNSDIGIDDTVVINGDVVFEVWGDGVKLYNSPVMTVDSDALAISVNVKGISDLKLVATQYDGNNYADHANWGNARLVVKAESAFLSDLNWDSATTGWAGYPIKKDLSIENNPLTINGTTYAKGLGAHAPNEIIYQLSGAYNKFQAVIGIDDEMSATGDVVFEVWTDGVLTYQSPTITTQSAAVALDIDITGVNTLKLKTLQVDNNWADHANWADAKVVAN